MGHKCIADKTQSLEQTDPDRLKRVSNSSTFVNRSNCEPSQTVGDVTMATAIFIYSLWQPHQYCTAHRKFHIALLPFAKMMICEFCCLSSHSCKYGNIFYICSNL